MKQSLLELTQDILSDMNSDEVNSISDTSESMQVAKLIRRAYADIITRTALPEHYTFFQLIASGDPTQPTLMTRPDNIHHVQWIKYDMHTTADPVVQYRDVNLLALHEFLKRTDTLRFGEDNVGEMSQLVNSIPMRFQYTTNFAPSFYTTYNDTTILFDSYDNTVDSTLQSSKTQCYGLEGPTFSFEDSFIPVLDDKQFPLLYNEAKSMCFSDLKQTTNAKAEQLARRQWIASQRDKEGFTAWKLWYDSLPNYGRR